MTHILQKAFFKHALAQPLDGWIISHHSFSHKLVEADEFIFPETGVVGIIPIIAKHKITVFRDLVWAVISRHLLWNKGIVQWSTGVVYIDLSIFNFHSFSRKPDYPLDKETAFVIRRFEYYNIEPVRILELFGNFIAEQIQVNSVRQAEAKETVFDHKCVFHGGRRDFRVNQNNIIDNQSNRHYYDNQFHIT